MTATQNTTTQHTSQHSTTQPSAVSRKLAALRETGLVTALVLVALEQQLASYTSEADQTELAAILDRYADDEVAELRTIMSRLRTA